MLNGRNVLIIGDSISEEFSQAFLEAFDDINAPCNPDILYKITTVPCPNAPEFKVQYIRNDILSTVTMDNYDNNTHTRRTDMCESCLNYENVIECEWVNRIDLFNASLIIMNRGAHYYDTERVLSEMNNTLLYLSRYHSNVSILFRNTPYGHLEFDDTFHSAPLTVPPIPPANYSYNLFSRQNIDIYHFLKIYHPHVVYMDVFTSTVLRADSHRDYLHYCMPGPLASWMQTFVYNTLRILRDFKS